MSFFRDKTIFLTGGTGSWGHELTRRLLKENPKEIRIYSRGEHAQVEMAREFNDPRLDFYIGDVRDRDRLVETMRGVDIVFHLAALKHVPVCERHIWEAVQTNIHGTNNVIHAASANNVAVAVDVSTDKAVEPINLYGQTKAVAEKLFVAANSLPGETIFACIRAGNVIGTHGSVIPFFIKQIKESNEVTVTDKHMTRFFELEGPVIELLMHVAEAARGGEIFVPKMPSVNIESLAKVMVKNLGNKNTKIREIGTRPGEKVHEILVSESDIARTMEFPAHFVILPYEFLNKRESLPAHKGKIGTLKHAYTSGSIALATEQEIEAILMKAGLLTR